MLDASMPSATETADQFSTATRRITKPNDDLDVGSGWAHTPSMDSEYNRAEYDELGERYENTHALPSTPPSPTNTKSAEADGHALEHRMRPGPATGLRVQNYFAGCARSAGLEHERQDRSGAGLLQQE